MSPASLGRRDFLLLRRRGAERVLELSCERLYMCWADARSGAGALEEAEPADWPVWSGEPPAQLARPTPDAVLAELERALGDADRLRVTDPEWLADPAFAVEVDGRLQAFLARGGRVE
jgi:hypothetical protein